ncbi:MAG: DUF5011 domain-containing protein [Agarilytica sp.]
MNGFNKWLAAAAIGAASFANTTFAQTTLDDFLIRAENQQLNTQVLTQLASDSAPVQVLQGKPAFNVQLDTSALFDLSDFKLELDGLDNLFAVKDKIISNSLGGSTWIGDVVFLDPTGYATGVEGRAYFVESSRGIAATIHTKDEVIQIFADDAGNQMMISSDPSEFESEGEILPGNIFSDEDVAPGPRVAGRIDGESPASVANPYTVDVLWVVTQKALNEGSLDVYEQIELGMTQANDSYENSGIQGRLRTVYIHVDTTYAEGDVMLDTLVAVRNPSDGIMDEIHDIREQHGADLVAIATGAGNYCGQAYLDATPEWAFGAVYKGCIGGLTTAHEFGHNFGAHHDKFQGSANNSNYEFGYGTFDDTSAPYWRTVMSYSCQNGTSCPRIPFFSSPELSYEGTVIGSEEEFNNARVHQVRMAEVAGFYPSVASSCTDHSASNNQHVTATRAYTQVEGQTCFGSFCWGGTTTYFATGSDDNLGTNGSETTNLAEEPSGYFSNAMCSDLPTTTSETPFAPEVQNLDTSLAGGTFVIDGEVFDANADTITAVRARVNGDLTWTAGVINGGTFSVSIPATATNSQITVDIRTEDNTGESFEFTTSFEVESGVAPTLEVSGSDFSDDSAIIYGRTTDPDSAVNELFYQVDGAGDPATGTWTNVTIDSTYWTLIASNIPTGTHTVYVYGVDETGLQSNVISADVTILPLEAPACNFIGVSPSTSQVAGEIDINGLVSDVNQSDVTLEYQIDGGDWVTIGTYDMMTSQRAWTVKLPEVYADNTTLNISMRANDSSGLSTNCGSDTYTVVYSGGNETPSCEIIDIEKIEGNVVFDMFITDPDGDPQYIYGKESSQTEWVQFWPSVISRNGLPVPGIGDFTIEGRVVDVQGNEGFCSTSITINDSQFVPEISYVQGSWESDVDSVILNTRVIDWDGDVVSVETRPAGGSWLAMNAVDIWGNYSIDLGLLANGNYTYEVRATDSGGRVSEILTSNFDIERQVAPTLQNIVWNQSGTTVTVSGEAIDANNNMRRVYFELDGADAIYDNVTGSTWSHDFVGLSFGLHSVVITAEDTWGMQSEPVTLQFEVSEGSAPVFTNINVSLVNENTARLDVSGSDADDDLATLYVMLDGNANFGYSNTGYDTWIIEFSDQSVGTHTLELYLEDSQGNTSVVESRSFEIEEPSTPCFETSNSEHAAAGRATIREEGGTCWGSFCFGGTDTYFAVGSDNNLGTNASTVNSLLETSPGYYELGVCNDTVAPTISLNGNNPMTIYQGQTYVEPGATATDNIDGSFAVTDIRGSVESSIIGAYQVTYHAADSSGNAATPITRTVNVIADDVIPVINIPGGTSYSVTIGNSFSNPTAVATDNVNGDISGNVVVTGTVDTSSLGTYHLYYNVSDAAGNPAEEVLVTVEVVDEQDTTPPEITLAGATEMSIDLNSEYSEPGYSAQDNNDGDITTNVVIGGNTVDTSREGTYVVTYNVSDAAGNPAQQRTRTVTVTDPNGGVCFTSTLSEHVNAGRAYEQYFSYYSTGTATYLGSTFNNSNTVISLEETSPGNWSSVNSCD